MIKQKITPFPWFEHQAEEAAKFYTSIFKNSKTDKVVPYLEDSHGKLGTVMTVSFQLEGQEFVALNGGPIFTFSPATSFVVNCETQGEVDELWEKLSAGGKEMPCGWLTDKFGVTWQIVPTIAVEFLCDKDTVKAKRVMEAILQMGKIDIKTLQEAYES